jgi:hypothetical protein
VVAWRDVPVDERAVGPIALKTMPRIRQVFIESGAGLTGDELERALFIVRKRMEQEKVGAVGAVVCAWLLGAEHVRAGQSPGAGAHADAGRVLASAAPDQAGPGVLFCMREFGQASACTKPAAPAFFLAAGRCPG